MHRPNHEGAVPAPESVRPLPDRPSLEFERKRARKLLLVLRRDNPAAKLAHAQFAAAREYGFTSWPRLVAYFRTLDHHQRCGPPASGIGYDNDYFERWARQVVAEHAAKRPRIARTLAAFVPRFDGRTRDEILAARVTIEDARLVVAREFLCPSWNVLLERAVAGRHLERTSWEQFEAPGYRASQAVEARDYATLERLLAEHPELLGPTLPNEHPRSVLRSALMVEARERRPEARAMTDWLAAHGGDLRVAASEVLLLAVRFGMLPRIELSTKELVQFLLDRGADPAWVPPDGTPILEHALFPSSRHRDPSAIDLIARRVRPRRALWIAAGLGDVREVAKYFDRNGRLTPAARLRRPDVTALQRHGSAGLGESDEDVLFEAFSVALLNRRFTVCDFLIERGVDVNAAPGGSSLLQSAIAGRLADIVEYLVSRGANLDSVGGGNPGAILRSNADRSPTPARTAPVVELALRGARDEASKAGLPEVSAHHTFVALLRLPHGSPLQFLASAGVRIPRLREMLATRLTPLPEAEAAVPDVPLDPELARILDRGLVLATERRRSALNTIGLLEQLLDAPGVAGIITEAGGDIARLREELARV